MGRLVLLWIACWAGVMLSGCEGGLGLTHSTLPATIYRPAQPGIGGIYVQAGTLYINAWAGADTAARLIELPPWEDYATTRTYTPVWQGATAGELVLVPRYDGSRDRLGNKFQLVAADGRPLGAPHFVDHLAGASANRPAPPKPAGSKGLQVRMADDALELGVKTAAVNIAFNHLIDWQAQNNPDPKLKPKLTTTAGDGAGEPETLVLNAPYIAQLDAKIKTLSDSGAWVYLILLNQVKNQRDLKNPLQHPATDYAHIPNGLGAVNLSDARGVAWYRALVGFLAERYTSGKQGHIYGLVMGNEVNSHYAWYNMGPAPLGRVAREYALALRLADLELRLRAPELHVYASFEHHWTIAGEADPLRAVPGRDLLDALNAQTRAEGDFPWGVAFHPYPENLADPRGWRDLQAIPSFDTPKITMKNIEVLAAYLRQPVLQCAGVPRRLALTEQGFNTPPGPQGELLQAAAMAYGLRRCAMILEIEAFTLNRHVDASVEGGLNLGLWTRQDNPADPNDFDFPLRKKRAWEVFKYADAPDWETHLAFAKPIIGIRDWDELRPASSIEVTSSPQPVATLMRAGRSAYRIVLPDEAIESDRQAATLLSEWLARATGTVLRVVNESDLESGEAEFALHVGPTKFALRHVPARRLPQPGSRTITLKSVGACVILLGDPQGPNDAPQVFIERCAGGAWFGRGRLAAPTRSEIAMPLFDITYTPPAGFVKDAVWSERRFLTTWPPSATGFAWSDQDLERAPGLPPLVQDYVTAQQVWNPRRNADAARFDALRAWYETAAEPMARYFAWTEEQARAQGGTAKLLGEKDAATTATQLLATALQAARAQEAASGLPAGGAFYPARQSERTPDQNPPDRVLHELLPWWVRQLEAPEKFGLSAAEAQRRMDEIRKLVGPGAVQRLPRLAALAAKYPTLEAPAPQAPRPLGTFKARRR